MPRPTLFDHPKFHRLVHILQMPEPHVLGHLEYLWRVGYSSGNPVIGDELDVELAAKWSGERGVLTKALVQTRFLDVVMVETAETAGNGIAVSAFQIHDLFENAPSYVSARSAREDEKRKPKLCERCGNEYRSSQHGSRFCSSACRLSAWRSNSVAHGHETAETAIETARNGNETAETARNDTPAPAPAPLNKEAPSPELDAPKRSRAPFRPPTLEEVRAYCRERGNSVDPELFIDHYTANGWVQGRSSKPVRDWRACVRTWEKRNFSSDGSKPAQPSEPEKTPEEKRRAAIEKNRRMREQLN